MPRALQLQLNTKDEQRLRRRAKDLGVSVEEAAAELLREKVREEAFPRLEFRDSAAGRQVYIKGHRLTVWQVVMVARDFEMDAARVADHLEQDAEDMEAALSYAAAYPEDINPALEYVDNFTFEDLKRIVPRAEKFRV